VPPRPASLERFEKIADPATVLHLPDHLLGREAMPPGFEGRTVGGTRIFASLEGSKASPGAYRALLDPVVSFRLNGAAGFSGTDPVQGDVTVLAARGRMVGVLAPLGDPAVVPLLARLLDLISR
jgi:hypothetical protein